MSNNNYKKEIQLSIDYALSQNPMCIDDAIKIAMKHCRGSLNPEWVKQAIIDQWYNYRLERQKAHLRSNGDRDDDAYAKMCLDLQDQIDNDIFDILDTLETVRQKLDD